MLYQYPPIQWNDSDSWVWIGVVSAAWLMTIGIVVATAISDGTSNTVLVVEACGQEIVWTRPQDIQLSSQNVGVNLPGTQPNHSSGAWSSFHRGGSHTLLADGSVRFISEKTEPKILKALLTATAEDTVGEF